MILNIDHTKIDSDLTDFPVMVLQSKLPPGDINKLNVKTSDGKDCYIEISGNVLWVKVPNVSSKSDTVLNLDYGAYDNPFIGVTGSVEGQSVWDAHFKAVWHLVESSSGTVGEYKDSTVNNNHGQGGAGTVSRCPVKVLNELNISVQSFAGNGSKRSSYISIPDNDGLSIPVPGEFTLEGMFSPGLTNFRANWTENAASNYTPIILKPQEWQMTMYDASGTGNEPNRLNWSTWYNTPVPYGGYSNGCGFMDNKIIPPNTWTHLAGTTICYDGWHGTQHQFRNGVKAPSVAYWETGNGGAKFDETHTYQNNTSPVRIGCFDPNNGGFWFPGRISEVRISNIVRSDAWLKASYYSNIDQLLVTGDYMTTFTGTLKDVSGKALSGETMSLIITKPDATTETLTAVTDSSGNFTTSKTYTPGNYKAVAQFNGDSDYNSGASPAVSFTVNKTNVVVTLNVA